MYELLVWLRIGACVFCLAVFHFCCWAVFPYNKLISNPVDALQQAFIFLHLMFFFLFLQSQFFCSVILEEITAT